MPKIDDKKTSVVGDGAKDDAHDHDDDDSNDLNIKDSDLLFPGKDLKKRLRDS